MAQSTGSGVQSQFSPATGTMPGYDCFEITPNDNANFDACARAIYVGVAGDIVILTPKGNQITLKNAQAGSIIPIQTARVYSTDTTATDLVGII